MTPSRNVGAGPPLSMHRPGSTDTGTAVRPITLTLILMLSACSAFETPHQLRGNKIDPAVAQDLVPGTSTRADATALLGSPTAKATFDDNTWLYISGTTRTRVGRLPGLTDQTVTVLTFDERGTLRDIKKLGQEDGLTVAMVERKTPSPGSEASFMQQLLGNVGKFNASGGGGRTPGASGGSTGNTGL